MMKKRVFVRNPASGEPAYYAGDFDDQESAAKGIGYIAMAEMDGNKIDGKGESVELEVTVEEMTDDEIAALPC